MSLVTRGLGGRGRTPRSPWAQLPPTTGDDEVRFNWWLLSALVVAGVALVTAALVTNYAWGWEGLWSSVLLELGAGVFLGAWFIVLEGRVERRVDALRRELAVAPTASWDEHISRAADRATESRHFVDQAAGLAIPRGRGQLREAAAGCPLISPL